MAYISFQPSDFFNTVLWTGNNGTQSVTGVGFQPDLFWTKVRSVADAHRLADSTRGGSNTIRPNTNGAAYAVSTITFDSDGFTTSGNEGYEFNSTGQTYVSWSWLANGGTTSSNTDGDITSTVQLNQTSGFSIGQYTGNGSNNQTVGTGLNGRPDWVMVKCTSAASTDWAVGTSLISSSSRYLSLNQTWESRTVGPNAGEISNGGVQILDSYTNGLFNCASGGASLGSVNASSQTYMFYAFRSIKGFSSFGSYTGNGSTNGTFIYTGFRPAFILGKPISQTGEWFMFDSTRDPYNGMDKYIYASNSSAENSGTVRLDFLSNGFKWRNTAGAWNGSGVSYIYMAFAQFPFVTSTERPGTAR